MKKVQKALCILLVVLTASALFSGCWDRPPANREGEVSVTVTAGEKSYSATTGDNFLGELLDKLALDEELHLKAQDSSFGRLVEEIGTLIPDPSKNEFVALYVSTDDMNYGDPLFTTVHEGTTYYSAMKGIDLMPLIDGVTYLFVLGTY